jgi:diaminohydroxyphosphoribosylaminopyrimidine deaminase/5-amino-6-(5-phosphoribosylamino)uracil reductase
MDAIIVGRRTAELDDPLLTARPAGPRNAARIVVDSEARLSLDSQLVRTAREVPLIVAAGQNAPAERRDALAAAGCEVLTLSGATHFERLASLLDELGRRRLTNVLVEGGGELLGSLFDLGEIDEVHVFIAPKLLGGTSAPTPLAGAGLATIAAALQLKHPTIQTLDTDIYIHGRVRR